MLIGMQNGTIIYMMNKGTPSDPLFEPAQSPLPDSTSAGYGLKPAMADMDGDGDSDLFVGTSNGMIKYAENFGNGTFGSFSDVIDVGHINASPELEDVDGDGDFDMYVGTGDGTILYLKNTGITSKLSTLFTIISSGSADLGKIDVGLDANPALEDIDGDGDLDC